MQKRLKLPTPNLGAAHPFIELTYQDANGQDRRCVDMTRDGFSLLAMGFTGGDGRHPALTLYSGRALPRRYRRSTPDRHPQGSAPAKLAPHYRRAPRRVHAPVLMDAGLLAVAGQRNDVRSLDNAHSAHGCAHRIGDN